jgi:tetratricopeptide (TPR) repeat protein
MTLLDEFSHLWRSIALLVALAATAGAADGPKSEDSKSGCCRQDGADIMRWHKNADRLYRQFKPLEAVGELHKILRVDGGNFEALIKMARAFVDIGDQIPENGAGWKERKLKEYSVAEDYARKAVRVDGSSTWGHFWVAASIGNIAMVSPLSKQLDFAGDIRDAIEKSIARDANNGMAYHVYGVWHRKVAEIGGASRMLASVVYGRSVPSGSLEKSIEYLKKAVALNPTIIVSRLELARSYIATEQRQQARVMLQSISDLPIQFSDDAKHKEKAAQLLEEIKDN